MGAKALWENIRNGGMTSTAWVTKNSTGCWSGRKCKARAQQLRDNCIIVVMLHGLPRRVIYKILPVAF